MNYRPEIDGLRAIAVVSVILYHAQIILFGRDWFSGGYIGVDIFFVISGYLITRIIITELQDTGRFHFVNFYERRARRILPMLLLVIAVCVPFAWFKLLPLDLVDFAKSALSALGFGSNVFFYYSTTEYGADSALLKPLLHTWSLGVEEQFYIIVPIIILLIWKFAPSSLLTLLIAMLLLSIQFAELMEKRDSELNFFLPFSRFWELLAGSILAFVEIRFGRLRHTLVTQTMPILGLFLIAHSVLLFDSYTPHPSFQTLTPIIGVSLILAFCSTDDLVGKVLSFRPIVGIGLVSYSLYLWHFPIFAFSRIGTSSPSNYDKLEWIAATILLSVASYYFIEKPFRNRRVISQILLIGSLVIVGTCLGFVNYKFISNDGFANRLPPILLKQNLEEEVWNNFKLDDMPCYHRYENFCHIDNDDALTRVYAFSDSHLSSMSTQIVSSLGSKFNYTEVNIGGCPFIFGVDRYHEGGSKEGGCNSELQEQRYGLVDNSSAIIMVGGRFPLYLTSYDFVNKDDPNREKKFYWDFKSKTDLTLEESFQETIKTLISDGHQVILIYPIPEVGVDVPKHIFNLFQASNLTEFKTNDLSEIRSAYSRLTISFDAYKERTKSTFELYDSIESPNIHRVYPHELFCDNQVKDRCVTHDEQDIFYVDDNHPSAKGSEMIVKLIMEQIVAAEENIRSQ